MQWNRLTLGWRLKPLAYASILAFSAIGLSACNQEDDRSLDLTLLHINDSHSHLEADTLDITLGSQTYEMSSGGFARIASAVKEIEAKTPNLLKLHAGDAITGTLYYTLFEGEADAAMMNQICFDAFVLGNHEFDAGDAGLKQFLDFLNPSSAAQCPVTPVLGANVIAQIGTPLYPALNQQRIAPYVIKEIDGAKVGIIGIDIASKTQNSSSPLETTVFLDEVSTAQFYIDELNAMGINKVILLTHQQYANDLQMASQLKGVDVIVGGDSHTLLGDFAAYGLNPQGDYPTKTQDAEGNPVCVVHAWQYAQVLGELNVRFNKAGKVERCSGTPHLLVEPLTQNDQPLSAAEKTEVSALLSNAPNLRETKADAQTAALLQTYTEELQVLAQQKIATLSENLCLERVPGTGRSSLCSAEVTKPHGGDAQQLVTFAFYQMAKRADIAIQNAGGVRIDVPAGDITVETAYSLLPFANTLVEIEMTGAEIKQVLEEAVRNTLDPNGSSGSYPYAAGLRWDMDLSQPFGSRLSNLQFKARGSESWQAFDLATNYIVVTNSFTAGGKDGYLTFGAISDDKKVDTFLDYAQSFSDYAKEQATVQRLPFSEYSTQNFTDLNGNFTASKATPSAN
ncbi:MAG: 5'-nucleotidase C-terminal domain-containing protein [Thiotrichales bacterium]|nr:5'-nucleotidase C-terminal domain-containing protein [Thiotrichales bacterium]